MAQVRRRRRVSTQSKVKVEEAQDRLRELAERQRQMASEQEEIDAERAELNTEAEGLMKFLKIDEMTVPGHGTHEFKPGRKNAKNVVDPRGFMDSAGENAFWATANIPMGEAKKHLGEKELETITTHTPGGKTAPTYRFK